MLLHVIKQLRDDINIAGVERCTPPVDIEALQAFQLECTGLSNTVQGGRKRISLVFVQTCGPRTADSKRHGARVGPRPQTVHHPAIEFPS